MLTFLRKIRRSLIESGSAQKYLLYAIGEIALVVIGILIALQINNWNEAVKSVKKERQFLIDIQSDLRKDSARIGLLIGEYERSLGIVEALKPDHLAVYFENMTEAEEIDGTIMMRKLLDRITSSVPRTSDTIFMKRYCLRRQSFRPVAGTFAALIADGNSDQIKNRDLFNDLQTIYLIAIENLNSIYGTIRQAEDNFNFKHSTIIQNNTYKTLGNIDSKEFVDDILYFYQPIALYYVVLNVYQNGILTTMAKISDELKNG